MWQNDSCDDAETATNCETITTNGEPDSQVPDADTGNENGDEDDGDAGDEDDETGDADADDVADVPAPLLCNGLVPTIVGTDGPDVLQGTFQHDVIVGLGGNDVIRGASGSDTICGGDGDDELHGESQADTIFGGAGNDIITGADGACLLYTSPSPRDRTRSRMPSSA